jgi:hypothetical protein
MSAPADTSDRNAFARKLATLLVNTLTVAALLLALIQFRDSRRQEIKLASISQSISTQFVGIFPNNIDSIVDLISRTNKKLSILADVPAYGAFSNPPAFERYRDSIGALKARGVEVDMLVYGDAALQENIDNQFRASSDFENLTRGQTFKDFYNVHFKGRTPPKTAGEFIQQLVEMNKNARNDFSNVGVNIRLLPERPDIPFFLWLRDDEEAVFSFYNLGETVREVSFRTTDGKLTDSFHDIFSLVQKKGTRFSGR